MSKSFDEMDYKELKELALDFDLGLAGNASKKDLIAALNKYKAEGDEANGIEPEIEEQDTKKPTKPKPMSKAQKARLMKKDLMRKERVLITDNQRSQTPVSVKSVRWGNTGIIGVHTDMIQLGKPWYVRRGALANLRLGQITTQTVNESGMLTSEVLPRYTIQQLDGLNQDQLGKLGAKQAIRDAGTV